MKQIEKSFEKKAIHELRQLPYSWVPDKVDGLSIRGLPDRIFCINGTMCAIEFKKDFAETRLTTGRIVLQKHTLSKIKAAGGFTAIAYPGNWEGIKKELRRFCNV